MSTLSSFLSLLFLAGIAMSAGIRNAHNVLEDDYDDFSEVPKFLRLAYNVPHSVKDDKLVELLMPPRKRYLGIDIPDYISASGKADALKHMSEKMKSLGKK